MSILHMFIVVWYVETQTSNTFCVLLLLSNYSKTLLIVFSVIKSSGVQIFVKFGESRISPPQLLLSEILSQCGATVPSDCAQVCTPVFDGCTAIIAAYFVRSHDRAPQLHRSRDNRAQSPEVSRDSYTLVT